MCFFVRAEATTKKKSDGLHSNKRTATTKRKLTNSDLQKAPHAMRESSLMERAAVLKQKTSRKGSRLDVHTDTRIHVHTYTQR
jgi:hypothetical protein